MNFKKLDEMTKREIKAFYKKYIGNTEYFDESNDLNYCFIDTVANKKRENPIETISDMVGDFFAFNQYVKDIYGSQSQEYKSLVDLSGSIFPVHPESFLNNYIVTNFCLVYAEIIQTFSQTWLYTYKELEEQWYKRLCIIIDNM